MRKNLLEPDPTLLPAQPEVDAVLAKGKDPREVAQRFPASPLAWALASDDAFDRGDDIVAYAFARVGYHRGLDLLRKNGWKGAGPIPWSHEPNRGVLRALYALRRSAVEIGEDDEAERLTEFLNGADATAIAQIETERG